MNEVLRHARGLLNECAKDYEYYSVKAADDPAWEEFYKVAEKRLELMVSITQKLGPALWDDSKA